MPSTSRCPLEPAIRIQNPHAAPHGLWPQGTPLTGNGSNVYGGNRAAAAAGGHTVTIVLRCSPTLAGWHCWYRTSLLHACSAITFIVRCRRLSVWPVWAFSCALVPCSLVCVSAISESRSSFMLLYSTLNHRLLSIGNWESWLLSDEIPRWASLDSWRYYGTLT